MTYSCGLFKVIPKILTYEKPGTHIWPAGGRVVKELEITKP